MAKKNKSASAEKRPISVSKVASAYSIKSLKNKRNKEIDTDALINAVLSHDISALSRAITLIESKHQKHSHKANTVLKACLPHANKSIRIGITGVPGVGKSTFIEALGKYLTHMGKLVAVLAIDPSSSITKGSILGDKTRMEDLAKDDHAFIRPSATGDSLGGVARKTRETIVLCEAAGFEVIIIETVGVGQSETTVHSMVDFFLLLKLAGAGDEIQGIKRGIIEMADGITINKADGENIQPAKVAQTEFKRALHLYPKKTSGWKPQVTLCSALNDEGIDEVWKLIIDYVDITSKNGYFNKNRNKQNEYWLKQTIEDQLKSHFFENPKIKSELKNQLKLLEQNKTTPFAAADYLLNLK